MGYLCCDHCPKVCECGSADCKLLKCPSKKEEKQPIIYRERAVSDAQTQLLKEKLNALVLDSY